MKLAKTILWLLLSLTASGCGASDDSAAAQDGADPDASGRPSTDLPSVVAADASLPDAAPDTIVLLAASTLEIVRGGSTPLTVQIVRGGALANTQSPVQVAVSAGLPNGVVAAPIQIAPGQTTGTLTLTATATATEGFSTVSLNATTPGAVQPATLNAQLLVRGLPGTLDETFGAGGEVASAFSGASFTLDAARLMLQPDGKMVVAAYCAEPPGTLNGPGRALCLTRLDVDGKRDPSFANGTILKIPAWGPEVFADGKILVLENGTMKRLNSDGSFDTSFGNAGVVVLGLPANRECWGGKISPTGMIYLNVVDVTNHRITNYGYMRFSPDGAPDASFGVNNFTSVAAVGALVMGSTFRSDGRLVITGFSLINPVPMVSPFNAFFQLDSSGSPDTTFGTAGISQLKAKYDTTYSTRLVVERPDGRLAAVAQGRNFEWWLYGVSKDGLGPDPALGGASGTGPKISLPDDGVPSALRVRPDGSFVVGLNTGFAGANVKPLVRLDASGAVDPTFARTTTARNVVDLQASSARRWTTLTSAGTVARFWD